MAPPSLDELRSLWAARGRSMPIPMTARPTHLVLDLLADGRPVSVDHVAEATGRSHDEVAGWFDQARDHGCEVDDRGRLVGAALTLRPTAHQFRVRGHDLFAWCGFDTLFLPVVLGESAHVRSTCPITGRGLEVDVAADGTVSNPEPGTMLLAITGAGVDSCASTGPTSAVCRAMPFLADRQAGEAWQRDHPGVAIVTLDEAVEVARAHVGIADPTGADLPATGLVPADHPVVVASTDAIHAGDLPTLERLLEGHPRLATVRVGDEQLSRTLLHVATDWPGHHPNGVSVITLLLEAGADVDSRFTGPHTETPLHWAASSDDVEVLDTLLDAGADIEATGGVIGNGTPLADAVAFGQWETARRLVERGALPNLWQAAALGMVDEVTAVVDGSTPPAADELTTAFWCACHGGSRATAQFLLDHGADLNWVGFDGLTALDAAERSGATDLVAWLRDQGAHSATAPDAT